MAMTQAEITKELERKASLGIAPTDPANLAQYNQIKASLTPSPVSGAPAGGQVVADATGTWYRVNGTDYNIGAPTTTTQSAQQGYAPIDYSSYINQMTEAQKQQQIAALDKSRAASLSALGAERATIQPQYYQKRNDAATQSALGAKNFAEYIAARGLKNSGENTQAQISQNVALQGQLGSLKQQEQAAFDDIARRQSGIEAAYQSDLASANAGVEAQRLQQLIQAMQQKEQMNYQAGQDNIANDIAYRQLSIQEKTAEADREANEITNEINRLKLLNLPAQMKLELEQQQFELEQAKELAKYAPEEARLKLQQIRANIAETNRSNIPQESTPAVSPTVLNNAYTKAQAEINNLRELREYSGNPLTQAEENAIYDKWLIRYGVKTAPTSPQIVRGTYDAYNNPIVPQDPVMANIERYKNLGVPDAEIRQALIEEGIDPTIYGY